MWQKFLSISIMMLSLSLMAENGENNEPANMQGHHAHQMPLVGHWEPMTDDELTSIEEIKKNPEEAAKKRNSMEFSLRFTRSEPYDEQAWENAVKALADCLMEEENPDFFLKCAEFIKALHYLHGYTMHSDLGVFSTDDAL